jgi:hypothetical protein
MENIREADEYRLQMGWSVEMSNGSVRSAYIVHASRSNTV